MELNAIGAGGGSSSAAFSRAGRYTLTLVPWPGALETVTCPPACWTIPYTVDNPNPVPVPTGFVVKKGSKMCS